MDKSAFVDIKAWFTSDYHADVEITTQQSGSHMRNRVYGDVSRASVYRIIKLAEEHPLRNNIRLSVYW